MNKAYKAINIDFINAILENTEERIKQWNERVKHISEIIEQDGSWNSIMLDEMARAYASLDMIYKAIEDWISKENFIKIYKD